MGEVPEQDPEARGDRGGDRAVLQAIQRGRLLDLDEFREQAWRGIVDIAQNSKSPRTKLAAWKLVVSRTDPEVKAAPMQLGAQVAGNLNVLVWDGTAREIAPVSHRMALNSGSSNGLNGSTSSSATADGERPPSQSTD